MDVTHSHFVCFCEKGQLYLQPLLCVGVITGCGYWLMRAVEKLSLK